LALRLRAEVVVLTKSVKKRTLETELDAMENVDTVGSSGIV
jgi:hypothetical protein